jgi:hypothetical protein
VENFPLSIVGFTPEFTTTILGTTLEKSVGNSEDTRLPKNAIYYMSTKRNWKTREQMVLLVLSFETGLSALNFDMAEEKYSVSASQKTLCL